MKRVLILACYCICFFCSLSGQCPGDDSLVNRFKSIRESKVPDVDKLKQLLALETRLRTCALQDSTRAILLVEIGRSYSRNGDYLEAIRFVRGAIDLIKQRTGQLGVNPKYLTTCYYFLANFYASLKNKAERRRALDTCIDVALKMKVVDDFLLFALYNRTIYAYNIGDYKNCYRYADMTEKFSIEYAKDGDPTKQSTGNGYAMSSAGWKMNAMLAMNDFETVAPMYAEKAESYIKTGKNHPVGMIYEQLAEIEMEKGNYNAALPYFKQAFHYESKYGTTANCRNILNNLGVMYSLRLKDPDRGIEFFKKSYSYSNPGLPINRNDSVESVNALSNLGFAYTRLKQFDSALYSFKLAYEMVGPGWNENVFLKSSAEEFTRFPKIEYLVNLLINKAHCYKELYSANQNLDSIRKALRICIITDKILIRIKAEQSDIGSKLFWRKDTRELYENAIEVCKLQGNFEDALYFFERSKAILLNDQLNEQRWTAQHDILQQSQVKKKVLQLERTLMSTRKENPVYDSIQRELFKQEQELTQIQDNIKVNNPVYYQYYMDTSALKIRDIQERLLKDHHALVEIFSGDSSIYILMIGRNESRLISFSRKTFDSLSSSFLKYLSNNYLANKEYKSFNHVSTQLHELMFGKLKIPVGRIIISPDGKYFPFEALVTSSTGGITHYFLEDHAVSYTYSARFLLNDFGGASTNNTRNFMGVAPVKFASRLGLPSLSGSEESMDRLQSHFNRSDILLNANATRKNFLQSYYRYKIIQLYTHASDSGFYQEPVIYFADSALLLSDLMYEANPATNLIVLSACETGTGKLYEGEGVFGFNRGFAALGIPTAISNLWQVEDQSTYKLTELFYQYLSSGLPVDVALQKAKLDFIKTSTKEKQLPYYWAGPVLTGKTDAIQLSSSYAWIYIVGAVLLGGIVFVSVRNLRRKNVKSGYVKYTN